ncbi:uncharacterized protein LOC105628163 [Jatropha curcas]|nr:uncharacterized protein LOC105628163 [Jatropha curcas]
MRASNQPPAASSTSSNGPTMPKSETVNGTLGFSSAVASTNQGSTLQSDVGKRAVWNEDNQMINGKGKPDPLKSVKQNVVDFRANASEKPATIDETTATLSNRSSSPPASKHGEWGSSLVSNDTNSFVCTLPSFEPEKGGTVATDMPAIKVESTVRSEPSGVTRTNNSLTDQSAIKSPGSQALQQHYVDQYQEPLASPVTENNSCWSEQSDWRTDTQTQTVTNTVSEVEEDIISFDNQRLKDPEVVSRTTYLPNSANSLHVSNHSRSHSLQINDPFGVINVNADPIFVDNRVGDRTLHHASSNTEISNGYPEKLISSSAGLDRNMGRSFSLPIEGEVKQMGRLQGDTTALDAGESSIISNILSLDLDSWDDSLTSPQNLAKLLGETDKQPSPLKMSSSWKVQNNNNNQSRFSFARQEESRNQLVDVHPSFSVFGQMPKNVSFNQDFSERRNSYFDKLGMGNGFSSSNFEESETFTSGPSVFSSNKPPSVSRAQISAPPGFSVPNRAPPPGFSSHERMDHIFDSISGGHLLDSSSLMRNSYQAPPAGNISSSGDIEFMDPAILAVGKGRLQGALNNPGLDMRSNFPQQLSAFENEARLQLLMQRSLSPHQNLRYADIGDSFSSLSDSYGISSRLVDQSQMNNLSPFMQMSLQHSRNGVMSNGHWDGWNEVQGGNNLGVAELLRNERLGLNKFYSSGYEDSKFRMPSSGDLYNRTFEM